MVNLISLFQTTQNRNRIFHGRLINVNRLETTFQSCVFFDVFTVLIQGRRTDTVQFTSRQHRLQQVACIHCAVRFACTDNRMQLIDKQNNLSLALLDLVKHRFQSLFELAAVLRARHQSAHIQGKQFLVLQALRDIAAHDTLCQSFDNGCLTDARFTNQNRVVFRLSGENHNHVTDLTVTTDDRIELLISRTFHQIVTVFI